MIQNKKPIHPGHTLLIDFMEPAHLSAKRLSGIINVPTTTLADIIDEKQNITQDIALRLAEYFDVSAKFWHTLQSHYDSEVAQEARSKKTEGKQS